MHNDFYGYQGSTSQDWPAASSCAFRPRRWKWAEVQGDDGRVSLQKITPNGIFLIGNNEVLNHLKYVYIYINNYIYIYISGERVWSPQCSWTRTLLYRGLVKLAQLLWNLRNFCATCTTAGRRAQHLWHVHNISETCTTSLTRAHIEYLKTLGRGGETRYAHIYIYTHSTVFNIPANVSFLIG